MIKETFHIKCLINHYIDIQYNNYSIFSKIYIHIYKVHRISAKLYLLYYYFCQFNAVLSDKRSI